jgi:hypothetical protein
MKYDFVEIGTSDFDTLIQNCSDTSVGLSIEPIQLYLDRLPNKPLVKKLNYAITETDTNVSVYWVDPDDIAKYNLPYWMKGCNTIYTTHPTTLYVLKKENLLHLLKETECVGISWKTLIEQQDIESIQHLKIDTEGYDCKILMGLFKLDNIIFPKQITFEVNELTNNEELQIVYKFLEQYSYKKVSQFECNSTFERYE